MGTVGAPLPGVAVPVLIVPYRRGGSRIRARAAAFVRRYLHAMHPDWPACFAVEPHTGWSKPRAVNAAVTATTGRVIVVHDADCLVEPAALERAVDAVDRGASWAVPHRMVYRLNSDTTSSLYRHGVHVAVGPVSRQDGQRAPYLGVPGGGILVVSRDAWETVGGFDERFEGWGGEDAAFGHALDTLAGPHWRGVAPLWHLYHPRADPGVVYDTNHALEIRYLHASGKPDEMRALLAERLTPVGLGD